MARLIWLTRTLAARVGIGKDAVAKIWADHNLKPWRLDTFKVSSDPHFEEKLVDVVGLYLNPPARAMVFSFDEKTQRQARTAPNRHCHGSQAVRTRRPTTTNATAPSTCSQR